MMAAVLDPASRAKLVNILGMLGSDFAGERASAGLLACRFLKKHGLRWEDVIGSPPRHEKPRVADQSTGDLGLCLRHLTALTEWEQGFCRSLAMRPRLSPKQSDVLHRIAGTLRARGRK